MNAHGRTRAVERDTGIHPRRGSGMAHGDAERCARAGRGAVWLARAAAGAAWALAVGAVGVSVPVTDRAPRLDGDLDDACWRQAAVLDTLFRNQTADPVRDTTVWLAHDDAWLYLGVRGANSNMPHVVQTVFTPDGAVQQDESLEIFLRPDAASRRYYHIALSFANVLRDTRISETGSREDHWNPPLRSAARRLPDGWTAELAIPMCALEADDLAGLRINLLRNLLEVRLDPYGAKMEEQRLVHVLKAGAAGSPHDERNFLPAAGLGPARPAVPFAPRIDAAEIAGLRQTGGACSYELRVTLETGTPKSGRARLRVLEADGTDERAALTLPVELDGRRDLTLCVPMPDRRERRVRVVLEDPSDGNLLAERRLVDVSALRVIRNAVAGRSYYTSEAAAEVRLEVGLPAGMLERAVLFLEADGKPVSEIRGLQPVMTASVPSGDLKTGDNTLLLRVALDGVGLAEQTVTVRKLDPRPGYEVKADRLRGVLLKDGEPFFPLAIMTHPMGLGITARGLQDGEEPIFAFLKDVGFNTLVRQSFYYTNADLFLRLADKYGMEVVDWDCPQPRPIGWTPGTWPPPPTRLSLPERLAIHRAWYDGLEPGLAANAAILREHRNLLAYYSVDEPNLVNPNERIAVADWFWHTVTPVDPYRPHILLYARSIPHGDDWTRWGDVLGYNWYPCPYTGNSFFSEPGLASAWFAWDVRRRCRQDHKVMIFLAGANSLNPARSPVGMSKIHMLNQAYSVVIEGARGIFYFALGNVVGPDAWDALRTITRQFRELAPALGQGDIPQDIRYAPDTYRPEERRFPPVIAAAYRYPSGKPLLLAANLRPCAVETTFRVDGLQRVTRLFEPASPAVRGTAFAETLEPYGVRAYSLDLAGDPGPVRVALDMTVRDDLPAPAPDIPGMARRAMHGKNHIPNPCFRQRTNPGIPDFYRPFFCLSIDPDAGKTGSSWYVDDTVRWNGLPSLSMFKRPLREPGPKTRGAYGVWYPPPADQPRTMTFSFHGKSESPGGSLLVNWLFGQDPLAFDLTPEWQRYQATGTVAGRVRGGNLAGRDFVMSPGAGNRIWISGLQMEAGDAATEFVDDSLTGQAPAGAVLPEPGNLLINGKAESGSTAGWEGLGNPQRGEHGVRQGAGRGGGAAFVWRGPGATVRSGLAPVNTAMTHVVAGYFRPLGDRPCQVILGLTFFDRERRPIKRWNVRPDLETCTELAAEYRPGDTVLRVRNASRWKTGPSCVAAFDPRPDAPDFDLAVDVAQVSQDGDAWQVRVNTPCSRGFPAGTPVCENRAGSNGIFFFGTLSNGWTEIRGMVAPQDWWPGTAFVRVLIQSRDAAAAAGILMDDLTLREAPEPP